MANDKTYDRRINIWINGKEVKNDIASIEKEFFKLKNEIKNTTTGTKEYYDKIKELKKIDKILIDHRKEVKGTGDSWTKLKGLFSSAQGIVFAGIASITAGYQSLKAVIFSTDALGDKFEITLGGWKGGLDAVARAIANMDFKNFGKNIREAIDEGRRYAESLDQIDDKSRALRVEEAISKNELLKQIEIQNDVRKSLEERNKAGLKAKQIEEDLAKLRTGIADQAFQNEIDNIVKITHLHVDEIYALIRQKKTMLDNIEAGRKYNQQLIELKNLEALINNVQVTDEQVIAYRTLSTAVENTSEEIKRYAFAITNLPGPEKMSLLAEKIIALEAAKGSALENTMSIRSKNAKIENKLNKQQSDDTDNQIVKFNNLQASIRDVETELKNYFDVKNLKISDPDESIRERRKAQLIDLENQKVIAQDNALALIDFEKQTNEIIRRNEIDDAEATGASIQLINEKYAKLDKKLDEEKLKTKLELAAGFFGNISTLFGKQTAVGKAAAVAETTINTYKSATASYASLAAIPVVGPALGFAAAAAAVAAGLANVKQILSVKTDEKEYYSGGYTSPGGKYQPAGIVHAGEWVANADMVANPATGRIIRALEYDRQNRLVGLANGGMTTPGTGQQGSTGPGTGSLFTQDPKVAATLNNIDKWLGYLRREGVFMKFGYLDVDGVRKGIKKLEDTEDSVSAK